MINNVLVDTGAIVGVINERDQNFAMAGPLFRKLSKPLYTCEAVITEALFLLRKRPGGQRGVFDLLTTGALCIEFSLANELGTVFALMTKYESVPMSLADACLVRMSELSRAVVFTFDGDFRIYRKFGRQRIPLIGIEN